MKKPVFTGAGIAIITPFHEDGSVNYEEFGRIIDYHGRHHRLRHDRRSLCPAR